MSIAVIPVLFTEEERPRAIAVVMGATFLGFPVGPLLGGWLLDKFWWGSVFLINVPVAVLALIAVVTLMPESHGARGRRIDIPGIALSSLGLAGLTYGCIKAGEDGWDAPPPWPPWWTAPGLLALFVAWERHVTHRGQPLIELDLFHSAGFTLGHHPDHVRVVRDVRHPVRHAAVLPGGAGPGLLRQRAAAAASSAGWWQAWRAAPGCRLPAGLRMAPRPGTPRWGPGPWWPQAS